MKLLKTLLALAFLTTPSLAFSEVKFEEDTNALTISGVTDYKQVVAATNTLREEDVAYVYMWGPGGHAEVYLTLGGMLDRETGVTVVIPKGKDCISACAFAAMGADHIQVDGRLMLHVAYYPVVPFFDSLEHISTQIAKFHVKQAFYLEDQGYSRQIMRDLLRHTSHCKFLVYEDIVVKEPDDLNMWLLEDKCDFIRMLKTMDR